MSMWMSYYTLKGGLRKKISKKGFGVVNIENKMRENHLHQFDYVEGGNIKKLR